MDNIRNSLKYYIAIKLSNHSLKEKMTPEEIIEIIQSDDRKMPPFLKSFATHYKSKHWSNNNNIHPCQIYIKSNKKYMFNCELCNHQFESTPNRVSSGGWCGYCANKQLCDNKNCKLCFNKSFASHKKSKYWSDKNNTSSRQEFKNSGKKFWFNCNNCCHDFQISLNHVIGGRWCVYCSNKKICNNFVCNLCYQKSFASHEKSKYWSSRNDMLPNLVFKNTNKKFWFECNCGHAFEASPNIITHKHSWCPYCSNPPKKLCNKECPDCFNKSFASHKKSKYWSDKNNINPRLVFLNTHKKYLFDCECGHTFESSLSNINTGYWCPYCSDPSSKLCNNHNCDYCFNKSFASHERVKYWDSKNKVSPRLIFKKSHKKFWFICEHNHSFCSHIYHITNGTWCPTCKNKTEKNLLDWLKNNYSEIKICYQKKFEWCKNPETDRYLPFDFYIDKFKVIIELDGRHHFEQVDNWNSPEENTNKDKYKMVQALNNGISVIRILQDDVYCNKNKWKNKLKESIKQYNKPKIIFIENGNKYANHKL